MDTNGKSGKRADKPGLRQRLARWAVLWGADLLLTLGAGSISIGAAMICPPAGMIVGGALLIAGGVLCARGGI